MSDFFNQPNNAAQERVAALRQMMRDVLHCDALLIPTSDPHGSEYLADYWQCRAWLTGFSGSAGTAVVTLTKAALWTDSRYWLQAADELSGSPFTLMKDGNADTPSPQNWLQEQFSTATHPILGILGAVTAYADYQNWQQELGLHFTVKVISEDPFSTLWADRPALSTTPLRLHPLSLAGASATEKLQRIAESYSDSSVDGALLVDLAEIAWTLNLRGSDIAYNPVFMSYLLLDFSGQPTLFVDENKLTPEVHTYLQELSVNIASYTTVAEHLSAYLEKGHSLALPEETPVGLYTQWAEKGYSQQMHCIPSPVSALKAIKNETELNGFRQAMEKDGVAMVRFLRRLDEWVAQGNFTEMDVDAQLTALREENPGYISLSFATIAAYGAHGAIVHYEATPETAATLHQKGLLLLDSGVQYQEGTTDITRTLPLGPLTEEEKRVYTLVLKGHIALSQLRFPEGTTGLALDLAARQAMWAAGYDFGHGTGHGVGACLCVHEGPQQIRKNLRACTLVGFMPGMTITNEPGIYVTGKFGVRIENTMCVVSDGTTDFGRWCRFEALTLCPIDRRAIDFNLMTRSEVAWLNSYHEEVRRRLLPLLSDEADRDFLIAQTAPLPLSAALA